MGRASHADYIASRKVLGTKSTSQKNIAQSSVPAKSTTPQKRPTSAVKAPHKAVPQHADEAPSRTKPRVAPSALVKRHRIESKPKRHLDDDETLHVKSSKKSEEPVVAEPEDNAEEAVTTKRHRAPIRRTRQNIVRAQKPDRPRNFIRKQTMHDYFSTTIRGVYKDLLKDIGFNTRRDRMRKSKTALVALQKVVESSLITITNDAARFADQCERRGVRPSDIGRAAVAFFDARPHMYYSGDLYGPYASELANEENEEKDVDEAQA